MRTQVPLESMPLDVLQRKELIQKYAARACSNKQLGKTVSEGFLSPVTGVSPPPQDLPDLDLSLGGGDGSSSGAAMAAAARGGGVRPGLVRTKSPVVRREWSRLEPVTSVRACMFVLALV